MSKENKLPTALEMLYNDGFINTDSFSIELCAMYMGKFLDMHTNKDKNNRVKIKRITFNGGQPDFILSTQQYHDGGGYTGFLRDNCISISIIDKVIDDEMSEKEFYTLGDWEG